MKKIILALSILCGLPGLSQTNITTQIRALIEKQAVFQPVMPFKVSVMQNPEADVLVSDATYAQLDTEIAHNVFIIKPQQIELKLPYRDSTIVMLLYRAEVTANGFHIDTDKQKNVSYTPGAFYRGIIKGNPNSVAAFSFFKNQVYGIVSAHGIGNVVVGKLNVTGNVDDYIIYSDLNLKQRKHFGCTISDSQHPVRPVLPKSGLENPGEHCVSLYFELRHNAFEANGSNVGQTVDWLTALFNNVQTLFENDGISTALKSVYVWEEEDPYDMAPPSAYDVLDQFTAQTPVFDGDAGQLIHYGGGMGLAYDIGAICSNRNRSFAMVNQFYQPVPTFSWGVNIIAHELGHTLGSQHTHGCYWNGDDTPIDGCAGVEGTCEPGPIPTDEEGGTIMSYCDNINFANGFGPQPAERIRQHIAASQCLGTDCVTSCINLISAVKLLNVTLSTATLAWNDSGSAAWEVGFAAFGSEVTNWQQVVQNSFTVEGLQPNTYYTFSVRNICSQGVSPGSISLSFNTAADWCSGAVWTDTGGVESNYESQRSVSIIKPMEPGQAISVTFDDFFTQMQDILYVYNGEGTSAPLLGTWSGYLPPTETYTSTDASGALTFEFITNTGSLPSYGWIAQIECGTLGFHNADYSGLSYYPNPVKDKLTVNVPKGLSGAALYNMTGQLLAAIPVDATSCEIEMDAYPPGIYLLELRSTSVNYVKVLKQ